MRSRANLPVVVAYGLVSLLVLGFLVDQVGGQFLLQPVYHVTAAFATGAQLVAGDDVTVSGVQVGRVGQVQPADGGALAALEIHTGFAPLFRDARAMIKSKNLLGETYVELSRGTPAAGPLADGGQIPRQRTLTPVEVDQVLSVLDADTRQRLVLLINTLGEAVQGRGQDLNASAADLRDVARSLETIAGAVASQSGHLDTLLASLDKVLQTLAAYHEQVRLLITDWDRLMRTLASSETDLEGTIVQEDRVAAILDQALAGGNARGLHDAIAEAPGLLDRTDRYLVNSQVIFGHLDSETPAVVDVLDRLASVMSGTDPRGDHMWRVYAVAGAGPASVPAGGGGR
ncbi:MAG TPA: MlaD family protein [Candidatus Dormibacteraeota bacterium]|nr:MlaD family protein [Candidatus Dormibacteraeota bacterium]